MQQVKAIPVSVALQTLKRGRVRELILLVELKDLTKGFFDESDLQSLFEKCSVKTRQSFDKQLSRLIADEWIGKGESRYHIRGFDRYCRIHRLDAKRRIKYIHIPEIRKMRAYLFSGFVGHQVNRIKYYFTQTKFGKIASCQWGRVYQAVKRTGKVYNRFGVSMNRIATLIGFTRNYMVRMKRESVAFGFLQCKHLFADWGDRRKQLNDEILCSLDFRTKKCVTL